MLMLSTDVDQTTCKNPRKLPSDCVVEATFVDINSSRDQPQHLDQTPLRLRLNREQRLISVQNRSHRLSITRESPPLAVMRTVGAPSDGFLVVQAEGVLPGDSDEHRCRRHPCESSRALFPFGGLHQLGIGLGRGGTVGSASQRMVDRLKWVVGRMHTTREN